MPGPSLALLLAFVLAAGPAPAAATVIDRLQDAIRIANDDPAAGADSLARLLNQHALDFRRLARDPTLQGARADAQLALARARLASGDDARAAAAMDEAIRTHGKALEVERFGPSVAELLAARTKALASAGEGRIEVVCRLACRVLVNERPAQPITPVYAGRYRVFVDAAESGGAAAPLAVELDVTDTSTVTWPQAESESAPAPAPVSVDRPPHARMLPRWAEIVALAAGAAALAVGATLLAIDGRCPGGADPLDVDACPNVYVTRTPGIALLAGGGGVAVAGGVLLAVDEVRVGRAGRTTVSVGLRLRF